MRTSTHLADPTPPAKSSSYTHTGIGGAGNIRRTPPPTSLTNPLTTTHSNSHHSTTSSRFSTSRGFSTGRGGAGNIPRNSDDGLQRAMFAFDEEAELQRRFRPAPVTYHTGRGGEGNSVIKGTGRSSLGSSEGSREGGKRAGSLEKAREWLRRW